VSLLWNKEKVDRVRETSRWGVGDTIFMWSGKRSLGVRKCAMCVAEEKRSQCKGPEPGVSLLWWATGSNAIAKQRGRGEQ
jgi:hypothetical protein